MRTLRKVFFIVCLALVVASTATMAAPADGPRGAEDRSFSSWALSVLDAVVAFVLPEEVGGLFDPNGASSKSDGQDEIGGIFVPGGQTQSTDEGEPPPDEVGGLYDPHG